MSRLWAPGTIYEAIFPLPARPLICRQVKKTGESLFSIRSLGLGLGLMCPELGQRNDASLWPEINWTFQNGKGCWNLYFNLKQCMWVWASKLFWNENEHACEINISKYVDPYYSTIHFQTTLLSGDICVKIDKNNDWWIKSDPVSKKFHLAMYKSFRKQKALHVTKTRENKYIIEIYRWHYFAVISGNLDENVMLVSTSIYQPVTPTAELRPPYCLHNVFTWTTQGNFGP